MAWVLLDDNFPNHPKTVKAGPLAAYLFICGLCYCRKYHTAGVIPKAVVKTFTLANAAKLAEMLVSSGLWGVQEDGYFIHGYQEMYDDEGQKATTDERRRQKREAGKKGGLASWAKRSASSRSEAEVKQAASTGAEAHRNGSDRSGSVDLVLKKKEMGPRDEWWFELQRRYPANRKQSGQRVQVLFNDQFTNDSRPDVDVWADMLEGLESQLAGHEWRVKGMAPNLDKWLEEKRWTQRHEPAPVSTLVSDKTARTLSSLSEFVKDGNRGPH